MRSRIALVLIAGFLTGCLSQAFVSSERLKYQAVKPLLQDHATEHPELAPSINDAITTWNNKLTDAEKSVGLPPATQP